LALVLQADHAGAPASPTNAAAGVCEWSSFTTLL